MATFLDNLSFTDLKNLSQRWTQEYGSSITDEEIADALKIKMEWLKNDYSEEPGGLGSFRRKWSNSIYF